MNVLSIIRTLFLLALPLAVCSSGSAASLQGRVTDVVDGESFTIISQKLPVKVRLIAIAAPANEQSYAGVARQHLADLILNKFVVIRYSALQGGFLLGQVLLGDMDVSAQMIRDGVAWYNKTDERLLSEVERQVYGQSQDLARNEHRGLWQDESPVAPWDFQKTRLAKPNTSIVSLASSSSLTPSANKAKRRGLSNEDLTSGMLQPGSMGGNPEGRPVFADASPGSWQTYQPADRHFSILAPSNAIEFEGPILDDSGQTHNLHSVIGKSDGNLYILVWSKGPNGTATDASAADDIAKGLMAGFERASERTGILATITPGGDLRVNGYVGRRYALTAGPISAELRVLSKQVSDTREVFMLYVLKRADSETSGTEFFNSFRIR
jgi:micrococcal nuclease